MSIVFIGIFPNTINIGFLYYKFPYKQLNIVMQRIIMKNNIKIYFSLYLIIYKL